MAVSSVPTPTFGPNGFVAPDESAILGGVQADMNAAFGGDMDPGLDTPQGQLATSETAMVGNANDIFVKLTNQVDPAYADGRMQDAIARIYFLERNPAQPTVVEALCTGLQGVVIPVGSLAQNNTDGNLYICTQAGVIGLDGTVTLAFACAVSGPIACPAGSLVIIYQSIPGWDSITNPDDGVLGNVVESRADFEYRRQQSVALNSVGSLPSILGSILDVPNVLDAKVVENVLDAPATIDGVTVAAHSIYASVAGGAAQAVGEAIWRKKAPGCNYNGNTTVTVQDNNPGYSPPYPEYEVKFETPAALPILFQVTLANNVNVPSNAEALIQGAIIAAFSGADGGPRARIGSTIYASRFYAGIAALGSWVQIIEILIGTVTPTLTSVVVNLDKVPTVDASDISVVLT